MYLLKYHNLSYEYIEERYDELMEQININDAVKEYENENMNKWINTKILDYKTYMSIDNNIKLDKDYLNELTDDEKQIDFKTKSIYFIFDIHNNIYKINQTNQYKECDGMSDIEINGMIVSKLKNYNNEKFYNRYLKKKAIENIKIITKLFNNSIEYTQTTDDKQNIKIMLIDEILYALNIFFIKKTGDKLYDKETKIFTKQELNNKSFKEFILENIEMIQYFYNYYTEKTLKFDIKNNNHIKYIYHKIKELLMIIDIKMEYRNDYSTHRENTIIEFINNKEIVIYKKNRKSNTLNHLQNEHKQLTINKYDVMVDEEVSKYFYETNGIYKMKNLKKINNKDILKLRNNLLMNDLKTSIKINDLLIGKELIFKDYYYNNITDMNISNVKKR